MRSIKPSSAGAGAALLVGIILIAASLRAPFTVLPPLLSEIGSRFALSGIATGALTTLPLIAFAIISPFGANIARRFGLEWSLAIALAAIAVGVGFRSSGSLSMLYVGTAVIGVGIAIANVLLPSLVKRDFPMQVASLTGAYVLAMNVTAGLGSMAVLPMYHALDWQWALASFMILPVLALCVWARQVKTRSYAPVGTTAAAPAKSSTIWRSPLAWQVTLFLGLNSTINYVMIGWLPVILVDAGISPAVVGSAHGTLLFASALPALFMGVILRWVRDQRIVAVCVSLLTMVALLGLLFFPHLALLWAVLFGIGNGAGFVLGLTFIALRAGSAAQAAALSGMAQCFGYAMAAVGPIAAGALHDASGTWTASLLLCAGLGIAQSLVGTRAGRDRRVQT